MISIQSRFAKSIAATIASLALVLPATAQDFSKAEIKTEKLSPTTYVLYGVGGNIGVSVGDDTVFIVDDQYAPLSEKSPQRSRRSPPSRCSLC